MAHEIGTHARRRVHGEQSRLHLLGLGLHGYLRTEEGLASYAQQLVEGATDFAGFDGHFANAIARGVVDGKKRDFRSVFEVLCDYYVLIGDKSPRNKAWDRAVRTFRGTTCETPGVTYTKDIIYREGNILMWQLVQENPQETERVMVDKYDPTNVSHIQILDELGITA